MKIITIEYKNTASTGKIFFRTEREEKAWNKELVEGNIYFKHGDAIIILKGPRNEFKELIVEDFDKILN